MNNETKKKRFQSGREVFETYIPAYSRQTRPYIADNIDDAICAGETVARSLIDDFSESLAPMQDYPGQKKGE